jgi:hypothetical protein
MDLQPHPDDHEAKMARADLFKLAQYSFKLFKMIHEDMELEGWVQAKITKSADYIASVYHYMEYEMKFSEYGEKLENSDVYAGMSESQQRALTNMLTEAKATMKKLTAAQAKKLKKKDAKVEEGAKPDFLDMDKDGNKKEPMKKALKDKKVKEGFPTVDSAKKDHEEREKSKGTGKFDKKDTGTGTQYTRKASTFTDGGDDSDTKAAKKKAKKTDEGVMDTVKKVGKKVAGAVNKAVGHGSDEDMIKDLQRKSGAPVTGKKPAPVKEASKAKKDYDKDGKIESGKDEYLGSKIAAAKKAGKMEETAKCNHSAKGKSCPVHGLKECGGMTYEGSTGDYSAKKAAAGKDIGKPGKNFAKIEKSAGGGEKGKRIAGAVLAKLRKG